MATYIKWGLVLALVLPMGTHAELKNTLRPFTTDGCTNFPNGVPYFASHLWLRCCVMHDVAYWQGGTKEMRVAADDGLYECVKQSAGSATLANLIYLGVRAGGYPGLPTSSGWGKGWTIQRGYGPLTDDEKEQIKALYPVIPGNIEEQEIEKRPALRPRYFLTGDHCLDLAVVHTQLRLKRGFEIAEKSEERAEGAEGTKLDITMRPKGCAEPFHFHFLLLKPTACKDQMNELLARGRIRLNAWDGPSQCFSDDKPAGMEEQTVEEKLPTPSP